MDLLQPHYVRDLQPHLTQFIAFLRSNGHQSVCLFDRGVFIKDNCLYFLMKYRHEPNIVTGFMGKTDLLAGVSGRRRPTHSIFKLDDSEVELVVLMKINFGEVLQILGALQRARHHSAGSLRSDDLCRDGAAGLRIDANALLAGQTLDGQMHAVSAINSFEDLKNRRFQKSACLAAVVLHVVAEVRRRLGCAVLPVDAGDSIRPTDAALDDSGAGQSAVLAEIDLAQVESRRSFGRRGKVAMRLYVVMARTTFSHTISPLLLLPPFLISNYSARYVVIARKSTLETLQTSACFSSRAVVP